MFIYFINTKFMRVGCIISVSRTTATNQRTKQSLWIRDSISINYSVNSFSTLSSAAFVR